MSTPGDAGVVDAGVASSPPSSTPGTLAKRRPRSVRVADVDRLTARVAALETRDEQRSEHIKVIQERLAASRSALHGIDVLRSVAVQERFRLGKTLQLILATKLEQRLKTCPPAVASRGTGTSARASRQQTSIGIDVPFTRCGMDEFATMQELTYVPVVTKRGGRSVRLLHFMDSDGLLASLGFSDPMRKEYGCRQFKRNRDGSRPSRVLVESHIDEQGSVWYILHRDRARDEVRVVARESEEYSVRLRNYVHELERRVVPFSAVPALPELCPSSISWRELSPSTFFAREGAEACGMVTVTLPCCVIEDDASNLLDMLMQSPT